MAVKVGGAGSRRVAGMATTISEEDRARLNELVTDEQVRQLASPLQLDGGTDFILFKLALVHSSARNEQILTCENDLLVWTGQTLMRSAFAMIGVREAPDKKPAVFTKLIDQIIQPEPVASISHARGIVDAIVLGGSLAGTGRLMAKICAQAFEAFVGAVYETMLHKTGRAGDAWASVMVWLENAMSLANLNLAERAEEIANALPAAANGPPSATAAAAVRAQAPAAPPRFTATVSQNGEMLAQGHGSTKVAAEQDAARAALHHLGVAAAPEETNCKGKLQEHFQKLQQPLPAYVTQQNYA